MNFEKQQHIKIVSKIYKSPQSLLNYLPIAFWLLTFEAHILYHFS